MNRQALRLPTALLLDAEGRVVKVYRDKLDASEILRDAPRIEASPAERLARAFPIEGTLHSAVGQRNYLPYGQELLDQGLEAPAIVAFERAAQGNPSASTLYRLGTLLVKSGQSTKARAVYERALAMQPDLSEASNDLGAPRKGGHTGRDRAVCTASQAGYPTPQQPGLRSSRRPAEARLYQGPGAQPDFPEALNNLGLILGRERELDGAETHFRKALEGRPGYGEAANNLALVLVARGQHDSAIHLLQEFLEKNPASENTYVTLAKIYLTTDRRVDGLGVIERLLQRNPAHRSPRASTQVRPPEPFGPLQVIGPTCRPETSVGALVPVLNDGRSGRESGFIFLDVVYRPAFSDIG
jgi:tetratricopeptide (TPR) repeat protein